MSVEALRQCDPVRNRECRAAPVGDQASRSVLERELELAACADAVALGEPSVADVQRACAVAQVAQDVRPRLAIECRAELPQDGFKLDLVGWVDRDELAAGAARRVLHVAQEEELL